MPWLVREGPWRGSALIQWSLGTTVLSGSLRCPHPGSHSGGDGRDGKEAASVVGRRAWLHASMGMRKQVACSFPVGLRGLSYLGEKPQVRRSERGWHVLLLPSCQHSWKELRGESVPIWPPSGQRHMLSSYFAALVSNVN